MECHGFSPQTVIPQKANQYQAGTLRSSTGRAAGTGSLRGRTQQARPTPILASSISGRPDAPERWKHCLRLNFGHPRDARFEPAVRAIGELAAAALRAA